MEVRVSIPDGDHRLVRAAAALSGMTIAGYVSSAAVKQAGLDLVAVSTSPWTMAEDATDPTPPTPKGG